MTKLDAKIISQIELLKKGSDEAVLRELNTLRKDGSLPLIPVILERWKNSTNETLNKSIFEFMVDIRLQEALSEIIKAIRNPEFAERKNLLIAILWQSVLDPSEYLEDLISIALNGDYMTILEVSTVVESFDAVFNEQEVMDAIYQIDERLDEEQDEIQKNILISLKKVVSQLPVD